MSELNRREFVVAAAGVCAAGACGMCLSGEAQAAESGGASVDVGPVSDYPKDGMYEKFAAQKIIVVRSGNTIYALSNTCTHKLATVKVKGDELVCAKHNSRYGPDGKRKSGPAVAALFRLGIAKNDAGNLIVDTGKKFGEKQWEETGASVSV